jgi:microcystin-dependent protein
MSIEVATYIGDLQATNPPSTDPRGQGDDHLRLIKQVLQNTFPAAERAFQIPGAVIVGNGITNLTKAQGNSTVYVSTGTALAQLNLPTLVAGDAGWQISFVKTTSDTFPMFISPPSGTISSGQYSVSSARRCIPGKRVTALWNGSTWFIERALAEPVLGMIDFWGSVLPPGFEWPNGQTLTAANYPEYALVRGSGTTPDLRGYTGVVLDNLGGAAAGRLPNGVINGTAVGNVGGVDSAAVTAGQMPPHFHNITLTDPGHSHTIPYSLNVSVATGATGFAAAQAGSTSTTNVTSGITIGSVNGNGNTTTAGSGTLLPRMQPSIMLGKILVVE